MVQFNYKGLAVYATSNAKNGKIYRYFQPECLDKRLYLKEDAVVLGDPLVDGGVYNIDYRGEASISSADNLFFTAYMVNAKS